MSSVRDDDIRSGPIDYFVGGIGDTLAKWYESAPVFARADKLSAFDRLSQRSAALIRDVLIEESEPALRSLQTGVVDEPAYHSAVPDITTDRVIEAMSVAERL